MIQLGSVVQVTFTDGSQVQGRFVIGCDGSHSSVRRTMSDAGLLNHSLPVVLYGFTMSVPAEEAKPIRELDPMFLQGTSSKDNIFMYMSREYTWLQFHEWSDDIYTNMNNHSTQRTFQY